MNGQSQHAVVGHPKARQDKNFPYLQGALFYQRMRGRFGIRFVLLQDTYRRHHDIFKRRFMREKIILLKHHANFLAQFQLVQFRIINFLALNQNRPSLNIIKRINAANERGFPRSRRTDNTNHFTLHHIQ